MTTRTTVLTFAPRFDMRRGILLSTLLLSACATAPAVSPGVQLDPSTRPSCAANCEKMGLELAAVVLVRNSAGCVCAVPEAKPRIGRGDPALAGTVAVAGGVLIVDEEAARAAQSIEAQNQQIQQQIQVGQ